jgi:hypothetical protein
MNTHFLDTGVVLKLIVDEPLSPAVLSFVEKHALVVPYSRLIELEVHNALEALLFRKQITRVQLRGCRDLLADLISDGRFQPMSLSLDAIASEAMRLAPQVTARTGCRTLDLLHIATARLIRAEIFVSTDQRQLKAAALCGCATIDLAGASSP